MNANLKSVGITILAALLTVGRMSGQTASSATVTKQTAWQVLNSIIVNANEGNTPLKIYPPGYLDELQAMGDSPYPPIPPTTSAKTLSTMSGQMSPMDDQQSSDPPTYAMVDLGSLGGSYIYAEAINNSGQIVGYAQTASGYLHAFQYANGSIQDLGTLGGNGSAAFGINDTGEVIGFLETSNSPYQAFLYSNGSIQDLGTLSNGGWSTAYGINDKGQIVGDAEIGNGYHAFLYSGGVMYDMNSLIPANSGWTLIEATGINDVGQIVGDGNNPNGQFHAFLYSNGSIQDLGTLGGIVSEAFGINNDVQIIGDSDTTGGGEDAFLWSNGSMQDLGTLGGNSSTAYGINNNGQVVGGAYGGAFLYSGGTMCNLSNLVINLNAGWTLQSAQAINDNGQIVGYGTNPSGQTHAFLLNPLPPGALLACTVPQKNLPPYGVVPTPQPGQDSLVFVTHGWIAKSLGETIPQGIAFINSVSNSIAGYLNNNGLNNWRVYGYLWTDGAYTLFPGNALGNAYQQGKMVGDAIVQGGWKNVHFVAHSAGAELIQEATEEIRATETSHINIQCTFLDAYDGAFYGKAGEYGYGADWADSYYSDDITGGWTARPLLHAYNVDVSALDQSTVEQIPNYVSSSDPSSPCYQEGMSTHGWPITFYENTVISNTLAFDWNLYNGFGFPLGIEGVNWSSDTSTYPQGNGVSYGSIVSLGPVYSQCISVVDVSPLEYSGYWNSFTTQSTIESAVGTVQTYLNSSTLATSTSSGQNQMIQQNQSPGPLDDTLTNNGSVWIATVVTDTNSLNYVSFDAEFTSATGSDGLLTVYWDTNLVGEIDEVAVQPGLQHYTLSFPNTIPNTSHVMGFHLDAFTSTQSSILLTNIVTGCVGVSQAPVLTITTNTVNGLTVYQLTGQPDNYIIEGSTNLAGTNWANVALVANTNGVVQFADPSSTNYPIRFYRALAQ